RALRSAELLLGSALQQLGLTPGLGRALAGHLARGLAGLTLGPVDGGFHLRVRHCLLLSLVIDLRRLLKLAGAGFQARDVMKQRNIDSVAFGTGGLPSECLSAR